VRYREALGLRKPGLDELASFHEPRRALGSEHVEHRLGDVLGVTRSEAPLLHGRHLRLEEQVGLAKRFAVGAGIAPSSTAR